MYELMFHVCLDVWIWMLTMFVCLDILWKTMELLEYCGHNYFCVSGVFLNLQRKLCPNFHFFIMHMFRGSFSTNEHLDCFQVVRFESLTRRFKSLN